MVSTATLRRLETDLGDLLARHEKARELEEFSGYTDDPDGFIRDVLGGEPWEGQTKIAEAVRDHPLVAVRSCNAAGKDWTAARLALWACFARRALVLITGPTERQVREVVMGEVGRAFRGAPDLPGELYATSLRLGREETAGILAFTSTEASRLTGFHAPRVLAILTEAQGVEEFAWEGVLACTTGAEDRVLAVGNPLAPSGRFYAVSRPRSGWKATRIAASDIPNVAEGRVVIPGLLTREGVERIASMYGEGSGVYRARVEGEFPEEAEDALFRRAWLDQAAQRWEDEKWCKQHGSGPFAVAVDPARHGSDKTAVAMRIGNVIERIVTWQGYDLMASVQRIEEEAEEFSLPSLQLVVDEVGLGAGLLDRLRERGHRAAGFNGGRSAEETERFKNARAESYWRLRDRLADDRLALPSSEALAEELLATTWTVTSGGRVALPPKDTIRTALGRSPDMADAVAMAFTVHEPRVPRIW